MAKKKTDPADEKIYSANDMIDVGNVAFDLGMKMLVVLGRGQGGVFVIREIDPETGDSLYTFDRYDRYTLVKDEG